MSTKKTKTSPSSMKMTMKKPPMSAPTVGTTSAQPAVSAMRARKRFIFPTTTKMTKRIKEIKGDWSSIVGLPVYLLGELARKERLKLVD